MLLGAGVVPSEVSWHPAHETSVLALSLESSGSAAAIAPLAARVPHAFLRLAQAVACHRAPTRWHDLYRVLWRLTHGEANLLEVSTDADVHRLATMERAVRRAAHKMKAFVRFRAVQDSTTADGVRYVAWFDPMENVVERVAPFFARRFASMTWSILTPDRCVHWDRRALRFTSGLPRHMAPRTDALEDLWRVYYANIFNPARLNRQAMLAEMPKRYWSGLPEASLVRDLAREAPRRVAAMLAQADAPPEPMPDELRSPVDVGPTPGRPRGVPASTGEGPRSPRVRDLALPGEWDPQHDPGTLTAVERAMRVSISAPDGIDIGGARVVVGAAGWTDPSLTSGGIFYPAGVSTPEDRLRYYASRYPFVEVDATYYALPTRGMAAAWATRTPATFVFDIKAHALMTGHSTDRRQLPDWLRRELRSRSSEVGERLHARELVPELRDEVWRRFLHALEPLRTEGKLGAVLLQYPRWFRPSRESADELRAARERLGDVRGAVELRHRDWMEGRVRQRTLALLRELGLAFVMVDAPQGMESSMPPVVAVTSPELAVIRLHGRRAATWEARNDPATERYRYLYDRSELGEWVSRIPDIAQRTQGVHVVCNNCHANYGTTNVDEITEILVEADEMRRRMGREARLRGRVLSRSDP